ncbi:sensor histidine kinase [Brachybacterium hainanense]|uniref:histidine kinase n=1 Tax=Brachybacterium hainanense TaxID=1541174 RepID=A0ABV6R9Q4_9MICO
MSDSLASSSFSSTVTGGPAGHRRILPALQLLVLLSLGFSAYGLVPRVRTDASHAALLVGWALLVVLLAAAWAVRARARRPQVRAAVSLLVIALATPVALLGTVGFTAPVLILAVALTVLDINASAGYVATACISVLGLVLVLVSGAPAPDVVDAVLMVAPLAVLLLFGVALGLALRGYEERLAQDAEVIARLRHAAETEKELLLADERTRSARDLHDGLGHRLTLVSMSLEYAERIRVRDPQAAWTEIGEARDAAHGALTEMRTWVRALSPVRDPSARGAAALEAIAESFRGTGLAVQVTVADCADARLTADEVLSLQVYRTVQEGLTNALRHSRARTVDIRADLADGDVILSMSNDMDELARARVPQGPAEPGFGLRSIADRAELCGGSLRADREGDRFVLELRLRGVC